MTQGRWLQDEKAVAQAEKLYSFIGKYVIVFQSIESKIDEMFHLSDGHKDYPKRRKWLVRQRISDKSKKLRSLVLSGKSFQTNLIDGWNNNFESVMYRIDIECARRNTILHSNYLFDFLVVGQPILQTHMGKERVTEDGFTVNQSFLTEQKQDEILNEVLVLVMDFAFCCTQLRFSLDKNQFEEPTQ